MSTLKSMEHLKNMSSNGVVVEGGVVQFEEITSAQERNDALDSLLYAQFSANDKFIRGNEPLQWYLSYVHFLTKIGYVI